MKQNKIKNSNVKCWNIGGIILSLIPVIIAGILIICFSGILNKKQEPIKKLSFYEQHINIPNKYELTDKQYNSILQQEYFRCSTLYKPIFLKLIKDHHKQYRETCIKQQVYINQKFVINLYDLELNDLKDIITFFSIGSNQCSFDQYFVQYYFPGKLIVTYIGK